MLISSSFNYSHNQIDYQKIAKITTAWNTRLLSSKCSINIKNMCWKQPPYQRQCFFKYSAKEILFSNVDITAYWNNCWWKDEINQHYFKDKFLLEIKYFLPLQKNFLENSGKTNRKMSIWKQFGVKWKQCRLIIKKSEKKEMKKANRCWHTVKCLLPTP